VLSARTLNRTLLQRQHLLVRARMPALEMTEHLLGLQAQEPLPPYLSLWSRIEGFDPAALSDALEARTAVRLLLMRGTIHLVTSTDAVRLRPLVQATLDRVARVSQTGRAAADVDAGTLARVTAEVCGAEPRTLPQLSDELARAFPGVPAAALVQRARSAVPLVQVPPRGLWQRSGGVAYQVASTWVGRPVETEVDLTEIVRRFLRAYGPATPADVTTWSGVSGIRTAFAGMADELTSYRDPDGRELFDLAALPIVDGETPAPVRLLGRYDNLWLSHAQRDRVTPDPAKRKRWMGSNGGVAATVFVDGGLEGLWRTSPSGTVDVELFRGLSRSERDELDAEVAALETLLSR
jgi:hypothetical protein